MTAPYLRLVGVSKRFGQVQALDDVNLDLTPGEVHVLLGANGSGKSTLVKIIAGAHRPDGGRLVFDRSLEGAFCEDPTDEVRFVHQEAPLVGSQTVLESVLMHRGYRRNALGPIPWRVERSRVSRFFGEIGLDIDLGRRCGELTGADRAGLLLATALAQGAEAARLGGLSGLPRLLVMDEVTASIPESQAEVHLQRIRALADRGVAVLMVTHRMAELRYGDRVTVLSVGRIVRGGEPVDPSRQAEYVSDMVAMPAGTGPPTARRRSPVATPSREPDRGRDRGSEVLSVEDLSAPPVGPMSFRGDSGDIIGFLGGPRSGVDRLPGLLAGATTRRSGKVLVDGTPLPCRGDPRAAISLGVAYMPADRLREGGVASLSVQENLILPDVGRYWHKTKAVRALAWRTIETFEVSPRDPQCNLGALSGGNQQKVLVAKWLALAPKVLVLHDPTYGVDPLAREILRDTVRQAATEGICVLYFSTEPEQLVGLCNRALVIREGTVSEEIPEHEIVRERVIACSSQ